MSMPMQIHTSNQPWHTIGVDFMGPFPTTQRQKQFILVVVDYYTRWVELFPMRIIDASNTANVLIKDIF